MRTDIPGDLTSLPVDAEAVALNPISQWISQFSEMQQLAVKESTSVKQCNKIH